MMRFWKWVGEGESAEKPDTLASLRSLHLCVYAPGIEETQRNESVWFLCVLSVSLLFEVFSTNDNYKKICAASRLQSSRFKRAL